MKIVKEHCVMIVVITKRCTDCNKDRTDFYSYKNGIMYKICKECFIKKVRCEFCNKELNKGDLRSHIKKQHIQNNIQHYYNQEHNNQQHNNDGVSESASEGPSNGASENNGTFTVGPSFCDKTHLLLNKLQLIRLNDPLRQIRIITRSPEQYEGLLEIVSVKEIERGRFGNVPGVLCSF